LQITCGSRHQKCILFNYELLLFPLESDIPALFTKISSCPKALIVSLIKCSGNCGSVTSPDNNVLSINCYKDSAPTRNRDGLSSIRANSSCNFFGFLCLSVRSDRWEPAINQTFIQIRYHDFGALLSEQNRSCFANTFDRNVGPTILLSED